MPFRALADMSAKNVSFFYSAPLSPPKNRMIIGGGVISILCQNIYPLILKVKHRGRSSSSIDSFNDQCCTQTTMSSESFFNFCSNSWCWSFVFELRGKKVLSLIFCEHFRSVFIYLIKLM